MKNFQKIIKKIAKENGTTPEQVLAEMQKVIDEAYSHHTGEADPLWNKIAPGSQKPTPEAFVAQLHRMLGKENIP
jgi:hypothetical protein